MTIENLLAYKIDFWIAIILIALVATVAIQSAIIWALTRQIKAHKELGVEYERHVKLLGEAIELLQQQSNRRTEP